MSELDILRGILMDNDCNYLGQIYDGLVVRHINVDSYNTYMKHTRHIIYMKDTSSLLSFNKNTLSNKDFKDLRKKMGLPKYNSIFHELGDVIGGIITGNIEYLDWLKLPILDNPGSTILSDIYAELDGSIHNMHSALIKKLHSKKMLNWLPIEYRWKQMSLFSQTNKLYVFYDDIYNAKNFDTVQPTITSEIEYQKFLNKITNIEISARRGAL